MPEATQRMMSIPSAKARVFDARFANGVLNAVSKQEPAPGEPESATGMAGLIRYPQPVTADAIYALKDISGHHSSCIQAKKYATVGLGFIDEGDEVDKAGTAEESMEKAASLLSGKGRVVSKVDEKLDPLTNFGFANELLDACEDFVDCGTGYMEVHRNSNKEIDGISQVPYKFLWPCTYNKRLFYQYSAVGQTTQYWVPFGKGNRDWLVGPNGPLHGTNKEPYDPSISEVISFMQPSNRVKYYGYPDWLSASVDIDLIRKCKQYKADFYHNRGVLDKVLVVTGELVEDKKWKQIEDNLQAAIGMGNNWSSLALNFGNADVKVEIKDMGAGAGDEDQFAKDMETLTQNTVSSHGVPPLLANILIPGKLGASNEFINALVGFQLLRINSYQNVFETGMSKTLGGDEGIDGLIGEDFRLRTVTSQIDVLTMDTVGKMRSEATSGENADRDLKKGVKK